MLRLRSQFTLVITVFDHGVPIPVVLDFYLTVQINDVNEPAVRLIIAYCALPGWR